MDHLWLIGMMGSGKTSVGVVVAEHAGLPFIDTDDRAVVDSGRSIGEMFETGEDHFRAIEEAAVRAVAAEPPAVVATGGGVVLSQANVEAMRRSGVVAYLAADAKTLAARLASDTSRPLLAGVDKVAALTVLLEERRELYVKAAHFEVPIAGRTVEQVAEEIERLWNES